MQQAQTLPTQGSSGQSRKHIPLARCRVLYLGSAVPLETAEGIEAVQRPLTERYPCERGGDVSGIDAWLNVFSSGLMLSYMQERGANTWFPMHTLYVCAAVKCVLTVDPRTGNRVARFVSLDSNEAASSQHPPMFACIMRRTKGVKVLECHVFICKTNRAALALVQSCTHAYEHKEGWSDEPPSLPPAAATRLVPADKKQPAQEAPPEFYERPPEQGYFYATNKNLVKSYNVFGGAGGGSGQAPPPGAPGGPVPPPVFYPQPGNMMGPPGAPLPPPQMPPQQMAPPQMFAPWMYGLPMPAPPAGYFADWDRYEGSPFAVFDDSRGRRPDRRGHPGPDHYRSAPRDHRRHSPSPPRGHRSPSPPRGRRPQTPPADYERRPPPQNDLYLYAPRYRENYPEPGREPTGHRRQAYNAYNPEVAVKHAPRERERNHRVPDENPYQYERRLPYPRADRNFGRSIYEERGDALANEGGSAYGLNLGEEEGSVNIDYGMFNGGPGGGRRGGGGGGGEGRLFDDLETTLGYYP